MSITVYNWQTVSGVASASFNAWVAAQGSTPRSLSIGTDIVLTASLEIPSTIDIVTVTNESKFTGVGYTLTINKMTAKPRHQIFGNGLNVVFKPNAVAFVYPEWFGSGNGNIAFGSGIVTPLSRVYIDNGLSLGGNVLAGSGSIYAAGSGSFTGNVHGANPTVSTHLTTKQYVDAASGALNTYITNVSGQLNTAIITATGNFSSLSGYITNVSGQLNANKVPYTGATGDVDLGEYKLSVSNIQFDLTPSGIANTEGLLRWNSTDGTLDLGMSAGDVTMQIGQELFIKVRNVSGGTIVNASPVYVSGRTGDRPNIWLAQSNSEVNSRVIGLTTQDITSPADGYVTTMGYVRGIKTNYTGAGNWGTTWAAGDSLYVSKSVAGQLTNVAPSAPHHSDIVGTVEVVHSNLGSILVNINKHKTMDELTDVNGTSLTTSGQFPVWNQASGYFDFTENIANYALKTYVDTASGALNTYITNVSGQSKTYTDTASGALNTYITNVSGQLNASLVTATGSFSSLSGYITNVSGQLNTKITTTSGDLADHAALTSTAHGGVVLPTRQINTALPLTGGGNLSANRTISMTIAGASQSGYLTQSDWNTFNNKASTAYVDTASGALNTYITNTSGQLNSTKLSAVDINRFGFLNQTETTLSFDGTNTVTLSGASWSYYRSGLKYTISGAKTLNLTTIESPLVNNTKYFVYIDSTDGTLGGSTTAWTLQDTKVPVCIVTWNSGMVPKYLLQEERHACLIDRRMHLYLHNTQGTKYISGATVSGYTINTTTDSGCSFGISPTVIADEDIYLNLSGLTDTNGTNPSGYLTIYQSGLGVWHWLYNDMPFKYSATYIQWDNSGVLTTGINNRFYNTYLVATNSHDATRFVNVVGQNEHSSAALAYEEDFASFNLTNFPEVEWCTLYKFTWETNSSYTNKGKVRLTRAPERVSVAAVSVSSTASSDHNSLAGLQGGTTGEYYHLTSGEYSSLSAGHNHGLGTSGYLSKFISTSGFGNSIIYDNNSGLGINTTNTSAFLNLLSSSGKLLMEANSYLAGAQFIVDSYASVNSIVPYSSNWNAYGVAISGDPFNRISFGLDNGVPYFGFGSGLARDVFLLRNSGHLVFGFGSGKTEKARLTSDGKLGIENINPTESLTLGTAGVTSGTISLAGGTSGKVTIKTQPVAGTYTLSLPDTIGASGQFLFNNGSGLLGWNAPAGAGTVTNFIFTNQSGITGTVTSPTSTPTLALGLGAITPTTINGNILTTGSGTLTLQSNYTLTVSGNSTISGNNSGDQDLSSYATTTYVNTASGALDTRINATGLYAANISGLLNTRIAATSGDLSTHIALTTTAHGGLVPSSRTVSTTSPLQGGGILSGNLTLSMTASSTSTSGYLTHTDWNTFNNKASTSYVDTASGALNTYSVNTSGILNTRITTNVNAIAATSGDLNTHAGLTSTAHGGIIVSTRTINTTAPLAGGGDLSTDRTLSMSVASTSTSGYLTHTDWNTFNSKASTAYVDTASGALNTRTTANTNAIAATSGDLNTHTALTTTAHGGITPSGRNINTTAPLTGGGNLSADRTISMSVASSTTSGYLTHTDWSTFNNKASTSYVDTASGSLTVKTRTINTTAPLSGGGDLSADRTLSMSVATTSTSGYLTHTDWNTFNNKASTTYVDTASGALNTRTTANTNAIAATSGDLNTHAALTTTAHGGISSATHNHGLGISGYLSKYVSTSGFDDSLIFESGVNIGIGTTNPITNLHIHDSNSANIRLTTTVSNINSGLALTMDAGPHAYIWNYSSGNMYIGTNNGTAIFIDKTTRNVGIGNSAPIQKLQVSGNILIPSGDVYYMGSTQHYIGETNGNVRLITPGNVGIGTANPIFKVQIAHSGNNSVWGSNTDTGLVIQNLDISSTSGNWSSFGFASLNNLSGYEFAAGIAANITSRTNTTVNSDLAFHTQSHTEIGERMRITASGNVGIGTTSPTELLTLGTAGTTSGVISLAGGTSGKVTLKTQAVAGTYTLSLPDNVGASGQYLFNSGNGLLGWNTPGGGGTVTSVSVTTVSGVSGTVATATTTPAISINLGAIQPQSVLISGTAGAGYIDMSAQSTVPSAPVANRARLTALTTSGITSVYLQNEMGSSGNILTDNLIIVRNLTGSTLLKGEAVYVSGGFGRIPLVGRSIASDITTMPCNGLVYDNIANSGYGQIIDKGFLFNTTSSGFSPGEDLYISATVAGGLTNIRPSGSNVYQNIGHVITSGLAPTGVILVEVADFYGHGETGTSASVWSGLAIQGTSFNGNTIPTSTGSLSVVLYGTGTASGTHPSPSVWPNGTLYLQYS